MAEVLAVITLIGGYALYQYSKTDTTPPNPTPPNDPPPPPPPGQTPLTNLGPTALSGTFQNTTPAYVAPGTIVSQASGMTPSDQFAGECRVFEPYWDGPNGWSSYSDKGPIPGYGSANRDKGLAARMNWQGGIPAKGTTRQSSTGGDIPAYPLEGDPTIPNDVVFTPASLFGVQRNYYRYFANGAYVPFTEIDLYRTPGVYPGTSIHPTNVQTMLNFLNFPLDKVVK